MRRNSKRTSNVLAHTLRRYEAALLIEDWLHARRFGGASVVVRLCVDGRGVDGVRVLGGRQRQSL